MRSLKLKTRNAHDIKSSKEQKQGVLITAILKFDLIEVEARPRTCTGPFWGTDLSEVELT